jgi:hypothetical protein
MRSFVSLSCSSHNCKTLLLHDRIRVRNDRSFLCDLLPCTFHRSCVLTAFFSFIFVLISHNCRFGVCVTIEIDFWSIDPSVVALHSSNCEHVYLVFTRDHPIVASSSATTAFHRVHIFACDRVICIHFLIFSCDLIAPQPIQIYSPSRSIHSHCIQTRLPFVLLDLMCESNTFVGSCTQKCAHNTHFIQPAFCFLSAFKIHFMIHFRVRAIGIFSLYINFLMALNSLPFTRFFFVYTLYQ